MTVYYADPQVEANVPMKSRLVGGEHVPAHDVESLPGTTQADINATATAVAALAAILSGGRFPVDLNSTLTGYLANLTSLASAATAANQATGNSSLASILAALVGTLTVGLPSGASTAANQATGNSSLASILTALNPGSSVTGQTSSTNSDATFSSQTCTLGFWCKNISTSSQVAYIKPGATATTGNGWQLNVGDAPLWVPCTNMNTVHHISSASGANLCWQTV